MAVESKLKKCVVSELLHDHTFIHSRLVNFSWQIEDEMEEYTITFIRIENDF